MSAISRHRPRTPPTEHSTPRKHEFASAGPPRYSPHRNATSPNRGPTPPARPTPPAASGGSSSVATWAGGLHQRHGNRFSVPRPSTPPLDEDFDEGFADLVANSDLDSRVTLLELAIAQAQSTTGRELAQMKGASAQTAAAVAELEGKQGATEVAVGQLETGLTGRQEKTESAVSQLQSKLNVQGSQIETLSRIMAEQGREIKVLEESQQAQVASAKAAAVSAKAAADVESRAAEERAIKQDGEIAQLKQSLAAQAVRHDKSLEALGAKHSRQLEALQQSLELQAAVARAAEELAASRYLEHQQAVVGLEQMAMLQQRGLDLRTKAAQEQAEVRGLAEALQSRCAELEARGRADSAEQQQIKLRLASRDAEVDAKGAIYTQQLATLAEVSHQPAAAPGR